MINDKNVLICSEFPDTLNNLHNYMQLLGSVANWSLVVQNERCVFPQIQLCC